MDDLNDCECNGITPPPEVIEYEKECDTCGRPFKTSGGMCAECIDRYKPVDHVRVNESGH